MSDGKPAGRGPKRPAARARAKRGAPTQEAKDLAKEQAPPRPHAKRSRKKANGEGRPRSRPSGAPSSGQNAASAAPKPGVSLQEVERELSSLLSDVQAAEDGVEARRRAAGAISEIAARLSSDLDGDSAQGDKLLGTARQLLSTDYYLRQWGRFGMRGRSERVDDFGLDPAYEQRAEPLLKVLYERYFRVSVAGAENLPSVGPALLVCNHGGAIPWDGVMLKTAILRGDPPGRAIRWLVEDFVFHSPFVGPLLNRLGAVRACQENAERLLSRGELVAVFPEGVKGVGKPFRERYRLQRFGRGGHIRLALRMGVPLIPVAVVGADETYPLLYRVRAFSKAMGLPFIPVTPTFPLLGPLGLLPLPSRWRIEIGQPLRAFGERAPAQAEDTLRVNELNDEVRAVIQGMLSRALQARGPSAFL